MAAKRWVHEAEKPFDVTPLHGTYVTINMAGQDVGYARVCVVSSNEEFIRFRFRGRTGLAAKRYIMDVTEVRMTERMRQREGAPTSEDWDDNAHPFARFVGLRCDIHMHQTRMFEATPGFFGAKVLEVDVPANQIHIRENSHQYTLSIPMICGIMESTM